NRTSCPRSLSADANATSGCTSPREPIVDSSTRMTSLRSLLVRAGPIMGAKSEPGPGACRKPPLATYTPMAMNRPSMDALAHLNASLAGRYIVEREIGRGGMATVYLARDVRHDRKVAVKVLNPELGAVLGVERFLAEIRVTANLQHPNLLALFDSGETQ